MGGWPRHGIGSTLMEAGAALIPGGNDTVLQSTLQTFTVAGLWVYLAMRLGTAMILGSIRAMRLLMPGFACSASGCAEVEGTTYRRFGPVNPMRALVRRNRSGPTTSSIHQIGEDGSYGVISNTFFLY